VSAVTSTLYSVHCLTNEMMMMMLMIKCYLYIDEVSQCGINTMPKVMKYINFVHIGLNHIECC